MAWYRMKSGVKKRDLQEYADWLDGKTPYYGFALLFDWQKPRVRLYHPDGTGSADLPREKVEPCGEPSGAEASRRETGGGVTPHPEQGSATSFS